MLTPLILPGNYSLPAKPCSSPVPSLPRRLGVLSSCFCRPPPDNEKNPHCCHALNWSAEFLIGLVYVLAQHAPEPMLTNCAVTGNRSAPALIGSPRLTPWPFTKTLVLFDA